MVQRTGTRALKFVIADLLGDFAYFPVWWYSRGAVKVAGGLWVGMKQTLARLAVGLWAKNLFVPMFGQRDIQGRLISIFMRLVQILARSLAALFWLALRFVLFVIYLALPPFTAVMIIRNIVRAFGV